MVSSGRGTAAFALSSFFAGHQPPPISTTSMPAYEQGTPAAVPMPKWQEFFKSLKDTPADVKKNANGALLGPGTTGRWRPRETN